MRPLLHGALALLVSVAITIVLFVLVGVLLPVGAMIAISGRQVVQDAPAHGGAILFMTIPVAGMVSLIALVLLTKLFYGRFSR